MHPPDPAPDRDGVTILLVDDDMVDRMAVRRAFRAMGVGSRVVEAVDGLDALERLRGENGHPRLRGRLLVLLDLNMPRMDGLEFLARLRGDPELRQTLVFVLTTSLAEADRRAAYASNIAGYLPKRRPDQGFADAMRLLAQYWRTIEFPPQRCAPAELLLQ